MLRRRSLLPCRFASNRRRFLQRSVATVLPAMNRMSFVQGGQVDIYSWDTYIGETTVADFTEATGTDVRCELFAKLRERNPGYDVIFPSNDFV